MSTPQHELERLQRAFVEASAASPAGSGCATAETIWQAVTGRLDPGQTAILLDHSTSCGTCAQAWMLARDFAAETRAREAPALPFFSRLTSPGLRTLALAAGIVLVVGTALVMSHRAGFFGGREAQVAGGETSGSWQKLPIEPPRFFDPGPGGVWRGSGEAIPPSAAEEFRLAMEPWVRGDYPRAATRLAEFVAIHPGLREARFYLGVSLLMSGRPDDANIQLARLVESSPTSVAPKHRWYFALALLKAGRPEEALQQLEQLLQQGGPYASRAAELRVQVRATADAGK